MLWKKILDRMTAFFDRYRSKPERYSKPKVSLTSSPYDDRFGYVAEAKRPDVFEEIEKRIEKLEAEEVEVSQSRHDRRVLERRRRKHDKFVKPKGEVVAKPPKPPKPRPAKKARVEIIVDDDDVDDATILIRDKHHEDTEEVIYYESEIYGEFNFRDTILQQLDRYFVYLARMEKHDPEAYGFYKHYGATLLPYVSTMAYDRGRHDDDKEKKPRTVPLADWFHKTRPAFGCFVYGADPATEKYELEKKRDTPDGKKYTCWVPKFMYFNKYKSPPPELEMRCGGDIYSMTIYWDRPFDPKSKDPYGHPQEFGVFVSADGKEIVALRTCETKWRSVPSRSERPHGRRKGGRNPEIFKKRELGHHYVPDRAFRIPSEFERWAKDNGEDPQAFLCGLFLDSVQHHEWAQYSMARVAVSKNEMTAVFGVNIHRTAYFFQDRDIALNDHGSRKQIFHMVKAHQRKDGKAIKFYFKGQKNFTWAGYDVAITIPGRDHLNFADIDIGVEDEFWWDKTDKDYMKMADFGKRIADHIKTGKGKWT